MVSLTSKRTSFKMYYVIASIYSCKITRNILFLTFHHIKEMDALKRRGKAVSNGNLSTSLPFVKT